MVYDHPEVLNENMLVMSKLEIVVALIAEEIKFMLLRKIKFETKIGDIILAMVMKVLGVNASAAADIMQQHCCGVDVEERSAVLASDEAMDVLDTKDKKEADDILTGEDKIEDAAKDIAKTVHAVRAKAAPAKKKPRFA